MHSEYDQIRGTSELAVNEDLLYVHDHIIYQRCKFSDGSKAR
jgi:hypothetical protein